MHGIGLSAIAAKHNSACLAVDGVVVVVDSSSLIINVLARDARTALRRSVRFGQTLRVTCTVQAFFKK